MKDNMAKDIIVDFPKVMQRFRDNRDNRRNYSCPTYLTEEKEWQMGGDFPNDPIVFKRSTKYKDKTGRVIYEWDYILVDKEERLVQLSGGCWLGRSKEGGVILISAHLDKEFEIVGEFDFLGKIVIKGIDRLSDSINNMANAASSIESIRSNIDGGCK